MIGLIILISIIWGIVKFFTRRISKSDIAFLVMVAIAALIAVGPYISSPKHSTETDAAKTEMITGKQYKAAQKEHKELVAKDKKLDKVLKDTNAQKKKLSSQESDNKSGDKQVTNEFAAEDAHEDSTSSSKKSGKSGNDMITGDDHRIVGNVNSHVYHMPGQRGYSMKSRNAVYFQTEQEAQNAGYRKARQ